MRFGFAIVFICTAFGQNLFAGAAKNLRGTLRMG